MAIGRARRASALAICTCVLVALLPFARVHRSSGYGDRADAVATMRAITAGPHVSPPGDGFAPRTRRADLLLAVFFLALSALVASSTRRRVVVVLARPRNRRAARDARAPPLSALPS